MTLLNIFSQMCNSLTEFNVMELSSHALTQDRAGFVPLELGVITNIGEDHLDFHRTKDSYVQAKLQLVDRIQSGGTLVVNLDDPHALAAIERASKGVNIFSFSTKTLWLISSQLASKQAQEECVSHYPMAKSALK